MSLRSTIVSFLKRILGMSLMIRSMYFQISERFAKSIDSGVEPHMKGECFRRFQSLYLTPNYHDMIIIMYYF